MSVTKKWITALTIPIIIFTTWSWGYTTMYAYEWLVRSQLPELASFSASQWIGFVWFYHIIKTRKLPFKSREEKELEEDDKYMSKQLFMSLIIPWIVMFFTWILYIILY